MGSRKVKNSSCQPADLISFPWISKTKTHWLHDGETTEVNSEQVGVTYDIVQYKMSVIDIFKIPKGETLNIQRITKEKGVRKFNNTDLDRGDPNPTSGVRLLERAVKKDLSPKSVVHVKYECKDCCKGCSSHDSNDELRELLKLILQKLYSNDLRDINNSTDSRDPLRLFRGTGLGEY